MTLLKVSGMSAGYQGAEAVSNLDLTVDEGEMVWLGGANGAGKTTTVMAIAGVLPLMSGEVAFAHSRKTAPLHRRARDGLGLVTEARAIFPSLTVADNLRLGRGGVDRALEFFPELKALMDRSAGLTSGGEQQMVVLGRCLASRPRLILADEMSNGLAPIIVSRLHRALRAAANEGSGVLLVEQHSNLAMSIADRAYLLKRGRIVASQSVHELQAAPEVLQDIYL